MFAPASAGPTSTGPKRTEIRRRAAISPSASRSASVATTLSAQHLADDLRRLETEASNDGKRPRCNQRRRADVERLAGSQLRGRLLKQAEQRRVIDESGVVRQ